MRNALSALAFTMAACLASIVIGDAVISLLTVIASVFRVARAYDMSRRFATLTPHPAPRNLYPYRFQFMR